LRGPHGKIKARRAAALLLQRKAATGHARTASHPNGRPPLLRSAIGKLSVPNATRILDEKCPPKVLAKAHAEARARSSFDLKRSGGNSAIKSRRIKALSDPFFLLHYPFFLLNNERRSELCFASGIASASRLASSAAIPKR
jgi:hypothetical protein